MTILSWISQIWIITPSHWRNPELENRRPAEQDAQGIRLAVAGIFMQPSTELTPGVGVSGQQEHIEP
jgi:hypothetical protein